MATESYYHNVCKGLRSNIIHASVPNATTRHDTHTRISPHHNMAIISTSVHIQTQLHYIIELLVHVRAYMYVF